MWDLPAARIATSLPHHARWHGHLQVLTSPLLGVDGEWSSTASAVYGLGLPTRYGRNFILRRAFDVLDEDVDDHLSRSELKYFFTRTRLTYNGRWDEEYNRVCRLTGCRRRDGIGLDQFLYFVNSLDPPISDTTIARLWPRPPDVTPRGWSRAPWSEPVPKQRPQPARSFDVNVRSPQHEWMNWQGEREFVSVREVRECWHRWVEVIAVKDQRCTGCACVLVPDGNRLRFYRCECDDDCGILICDFCNQRGELADRRVTPWFYHWPVDAPTTRPHMVMRRNYCEPHMEPVRYLPAHVGARHLTHDDQGLAGLPVIIAEGDITPPLLALPPPPAPPTPPRAKLPPRGFPIPLDWPVPAVVTNAPLVPPKPPPPALPRRPPPPPPPWRRPQPATPEQVAAWVGGSEGHGPALPRDDPADDPERDLVP